MKERTEVVKAKIPNGTIIHVRATALGGDEDISFKVPSFKEVTDAIEGIAESIVTTLQKVKPHKASGIRPGSCPGSRTTDSPLSQRFRYFQPNINMEWGETSSQ